MKHRNVIHLFVIGLDLTVIDRVLLSVQNKDIIWKVGTIGSKFVTLTIIETRARFIA